ncbi:MAG: hypothetical protein AABX17_03840 [Nanoarchaeota archaeon]
MVKSGGIPREVLNDLDITKRREIKPEEVTVIVERHQIKIPLPKNVRIKLNLKKNTKCIVSYDEENKEVNCKFK